MCNKKVNEKVLESFKILYLIQTWNLIKYSFIWIQKFLIFNVSHAHSHKHTHMINISTFSNCFFKSYFDRLRRGKLVAVRLLLCPSPEIFSTTSKRLGTYICWWWHWKKRKNWGKLVQKLTQPRRMQRRKLQVSLDFGFAVKICY